MSTTKDFIIEQLSAELEGLTMAVEKQNVGSVLKVADGVALVDGLGELAMSELVEFATAHGSVQGVALNLEETSVGVVVLGDYSLIKAGDQVTASGRILSVPVGPELVGRVVDALGQAVDGQGKITTKDYYPIEKIAPGVIQRAPVIQPLATGIKAVDAMIPIGRGQRELIIGDRQIGKTALAIDTIINQRGQGVKCIYVAIGQKESKIASIVAKLAEAGAMDYTTVILAGASAPASLLYLAPYTGASLAEYFMDQGEDVLVVYDDLSKHASAYREISLLLRRPPGREAYPGDVFYLHSRLLERACKLSQEAGGGSITALPIIETQAGDVSAYIPTNVISITDGQIYLEPDLFYQGNRPAVNAGLSVSRVGSAAQVKAMKKVAGKLRLEAAQYRELAAFAQFGSDLDEDTKAKLARGQRLIELFKQDQYAPVSTAQQVMLYWSLLNGYLDEVTVETIKAWEEKFYAYLSESQESLLTTLAERGAFDEELEGAMKTAVEDFNLIFKAD